MNDIIHSPIGWFHTITAVLAMISGLVVVLNTKGTKFHKRMGYVFIFSMLSLNFSSFFIINFGGFSIFHFFSLASLATLFGGIIPALRRSENWLVKHYYFMSWSVVGLYCAFWSEVGTRFTTSIPQFWWAVVIATLLTAGIGGILIKKQARKLNF